MLVKYFYLGITFITLTCGSIHAQDRDFGGLNRYAQENKNNNCFCKACKSSLYGKLYNRRLGKLPSCLFY